MSKHDAGRTRNDASMRTSQASRETVGNLNTAAPKSWPGANNWWIDAVGGFLTFTQPRIQIGQAGGEGVDLPILADLSANHAELLRGRTGLVLLPRGDCTVNGAKGTGFVLKDKDRIRLRKVELLYHQPLGFCSTARLEITSGHRLPIAMNGIVLLGETCVVGPRRDAHIPTTWSECVFLTWYREQYWIRCQGPVTIDGVAYPGWGPLVPESQVRGSWGRFHWEPAR